MPFLPSERTQLLAVKGVGPTVIARLEQMGFESFAHLRICARPMRWIF
jgi:hypothetical protein